MKLYRPAIGLILLALIFGVPSPAAAQLRIVSYNTLDNPTNATDDGRFNTIFDAIGAWSVNGIAKPVDIVALQEQTTATATRIAGELNDLYGVNTYMASTIGIISNDRIGVVYNSATVEMPSEIVSIATAGPRNTMRAHFRPVSYTSVESEFLMYISHLKAGSTSGDIATRGLEATAIRADADLFGSDNHIIYAGDFNVQSSFEPGYANLAAMGDAQALDPIQISGTWHDGSGLAAMTHTQSTRTTNQGDGGSTGGLDDRFDFQLSTAALRDGDGLSYLGPTSTGLETLDHSYWAFGNDGVSLNQAINNTTVGRTLSSTELDALHDFSDHLPVVADYQLPAIMDVTAPAAPAMVTLGSLEELAVTVENIASVLAAVGADELDYTLSTTGDVSGDAADTALALAGGNMHTVTLDTSTLGLKSGTIIVTSSSEAVENDTFNIPIMFEVISDVLLGDANKDGQVTGADLISVQQNFGNVGATPLLGDANNDGQVTGADLISVQQNFGNVAAPGGGAVPEPATLAIVSAAGLALLMRRRQAHARIPETHCAVYTYSDPPSAASQAAVRRRACKLSQNIHV